MNGFIVGSILGLTCGIVYFWLKMRTYKRILVLKATCCKIPENINGNFYYIVPEKEYAEKNFGGKKE